MVNAGIDNRTLAVVKPNPCAYGSRAWAVYDYIAHRQGRTVAEIVREAMGEPINNKIKEEEVYRAIRWHIERGHITLA